MIKKQIVVIDDSPAILLVMKTMLDELGYFDTVMAGSAQKALNLIRKDPRRYECVLTDLNMPDLDGMQVLRSLGEMGYKGAVCIISDMEDRVIELAADIAKLHKVSLIGTLAKPVDLNSLKRTLLRLEAFQQRTSPTLRTLSEKEIQAYLAQSMITPYYQPKIGLTSHKVRGVEVLARIIKPGEVNAILPGAFIPKAQECGLLNDMMLQLFDKALLDFPRLVKEFGDNLKMSFNISPSQLNQTQFLNDVVQLIQSYHLPEKQIVFEITEELAVNDPIQLENLNRLRMKGFGLSLDDFGTGFTNIQQLRSLPFTEVKIDRCLVQDIHCDHFNQVVVKSLAQISNSLSMMLIAEGMEYLEDFHYLESQYSSLQVQGYLICKPRPLDSLLSWHHGWIKSQINSND